MLASEFSLQDEFPPINYAEWRALAEADLQGAAFEQKLVTHTYEGIDIQPVYTRRDRPGEGDPDGFPERPCAADERRLPGEALRVALAGVVAPGVDRLEVDAFVGVGDELLLERRPLQVGLGQFAPGGVVGRREVVLEGELVG